MPATDGSNQRNNQAKTATARKVYDSMRLISQKTFSSWNNALIDHLFNSLVTLEWFFQVS